MKVAQYDTDVTDAQWKLLKKELPTPSKIGRPPIDRRIVVNAIFYVLKGGIQWRLLPESFPTWKTVYHIFRQWSRDYTLERLNGVLRNKVRAQGDKETSDGSLRPRFLTVRVSNLILMAGTLAMMLAKRSKGVSVTYWLIRWDFCWASRLPLRICRKEREQEPY